MNKENKHIINILKLTEIDKYGDKKLKEIIDEIKIKENDNVITILNEIKSNPNLTGFEMFGDDMYYNKFEHFDEILIKYYENETYNTRRIINAEEESALNEIINVVNNIYELQRCLSDIDEEQKYLVIDVEEKECVGTYTNVLDVVSTIEGETEYLNEEIIEVFNDYEFFDLGGFFGNYYPNEEILDSEYKETIVKLLKYYNSPYLKEE